MWWVVACGEVSDGGTRRVHVTRICQKHGERRCSESHVPYQRVVTTKDGCNGDRACQKRLTSADTDIHRNNHHTSETTVLAYDLAVLSIK